MNDAHRAGTNRLKNRIKLVSVLIPVLLVSFETCPVRIDAVSVSFESSHQQFGLAAMCFRGRVPDFC